MLTSSRLLLRPVTKQDRTHLVDMYGDKGVMKNYSYRTPWPTEKVQERLDNWINRWQNNTLSFFAVVESESDNFVGTIGGGLDENRKCEIAYVLKKEFWGKGYATEATSLLLEYIFVKRSDFGCKLVFATCLPENIPSKRVLQKSGMMLKDLRYEYGANRFIYEITKQEYLNKHCT